MSVRPLRWVSVKAVTRDEEGRIVDEDGWVVGFAETPGLTNDELQEVYQRAKADAEARKRREAEADKKKGEWLSPEAARAALLGDVQGSHYQFMGIAPDAQNTEIRSAYRTMSKLYHPDTTQLERVEANTLFVKLQDSYQTLSDSEKRRYYDWKLSLEVTAAARENGDLTRRGLTESGRRMFGTAGEFDIDGRFVSAMDRLRVDESMPLSDQATFSLVFDLIAFGFALFVIAIGCYQGWNAPPLE